MSHLTPGPDHAAPEEVPTPVVDAAKLGGLVSATVVAVGGAIFLVLGGITSENLGAVGIAVGAAVTALVSLGVYLFSLRQGRRAAEQVTPLARPRDARGRRLVPENRHAA